MSDEIKHEVDMTHKVKPKKYIMYIKDKQGNIVAKIPVVATDVPSNLMTSINNVTSYDVFVEDISISNRQEHAEALNELGVMSQMSTEELEQNSLINRCKELKKAVAEYEIKVNKEREGL